MNRKKSKVVRKELNGMRAMQEIPWPARRFKYPPTLGPYWRRHSRRRLNRLARRMEQAQQRTVAQEQTRRALEQARRRERRSPRAIVGRIFSRRKV